MVADIVVLLWQCVVEITRKQKDAEIRKVCGES